MSSPPSGSRQRRSSYRPGQTELGPLFSVLSDRVRGQTHTGRRRRQEFLDHPSRREFSSIDQLLREVETKAMQTTPRLLDVVALLSDMPAQGLLRGQVGTVVELLDGAYEVEFSDDEGK